MIFGEKRDLVIENIKNAVQARAFQSKVEPNDPELTPTQKKAILENYLKNRHTRWYGCKCWFARRLANIATKMLNKNTRIVGMEKLDGVEGAMLTCNHFSPMDNTVVRHLTRRMGKRRLPIISQMTNFAMPGLIGYLMNYSDTIPLGEDPHYVLQELPEILRECMDKKEWVLIYPEQEMWFHYRKPRPPMRGAYYFAAKLNCPVVSCFVEMRNLPEMDSQDFHKVQFTLHILDVLYPDPEKSVRENSMQLCRCDEQLKIEAYERIYGKPLAYDFSLNDIAGK